MEIETVFERTSDTKFWKHPLSSNYRQLIMASNCLYFLLIIACWCYVHGGNEEIPPNVLGTTMKECVMSHCSNHNSLSVWFSIQPFCYPTTSEAVNSNVVSRRTLMESDNVFYVPAIAVGAFSFFAASAGILVGTLIGKKRKLGYGADSRGEYHKIGSEKLFASGQLQIDY